MEDQNKTKLYKVLYILVIILVAYVAIKIFSEIKKDSLLGQSSEPATISFTGHGEVTAAPDIASISFSIESSLSTQSASSDVVNTKAAKVIDFLKSSGVAEKDIKTDNYSSYPKYSNPEPCIYSMSQGQAVSPCRGGGESKIIGYTVSENISAKIRKVDDASKVIDGINKIGVTNMSGPNFTIDDEDALTVQARKEAIDDARTKAQSLAKDLGVHLVRISSFSENGNGGPIYYAKAAMMDSAGSSAPVPSSTPAGENTISSDVTITYEIR